MTAKAAPRGQARSAGSQRNVANEQPTNNSAAARPSEDGAQLMTEANEFIARFCRFPDEQSLVAVTLWAAHTHLIQCFYTTPRLALVSPEAASGKTRVLEVLNLLVADPMFALHASPAAIFRTLASKQVALLFDEVDAVWSRRGQDDSHEDLRGMLNAGYKRGATIPRCVGPHHDVVNFGVYCAVALAGIGDLPETIMSRAIPIRMRRRAPNEDVEPFRARTEEPVGIALGRRLSAWAKGVAQRVESAVPTMPPGIVDRPAECWEPLLAVADAAGGDWPVRAREACSHLCKVAQERRVSLGIRLLADLRTVFGEAVALHTETILDRLLGGEELDPDAPWAELHGKGLNERGLAKLLGPYGVRSTKVTVQGRSLQGYRRESLWDAWIRYLPPKSVEAESPEPTTPQVPDVPHAQGGEVPCRRCDGEGCDWCGEFKRPDGGDLPQRHGSS